MRRISSSLADKSLRCRTLASNRSQDRGPVRWRAGVRLRRHSHLIQETRAMFASLRERILIDPPKVVAVQSSPSSLPLNRSPTHHTNLHVRIRQIRYQHSCAPLGAFGHPLPSDPLPHHRHFRPSCPCRCVRVGEYEQPRPYELDPQNSQRSAVPVCSCAP